MEFKEILFKVDGAVATITLNRPDIQTLLPILRSSPKSIRLRPGQ